MLLPFLSNNFFESSEVLVITTLCKIPVGTIKQRFDTRLVRCFLASPFDSLRKYAFRTEDKRSVSVLGNVYDPVAGGAQTPADAMAAAKPTSASVPATGAPANAAPRPSDQAKESL